MARYKTWLSYWGDDEHLLEAILARNEFWFLADGKTLLNVAGGCTGNVHSALNDAYTLKYDGHLVTLELRRSPTDFVLLLDNQPVQATSVTRQPGPYSSSQTRPKVNQRWAFQLPDGYHTVQVGLERTMNLLHVYYVLDQRDGAPFQRTATDIDLNQPSPQRMTIELDTHLLTLLMAYTTRSRVPLVSLTLLVDEQVVHPQDIPFIS
jgi:hypothetical protein